MSVIVLSPEMEGNSFSAGALGPRLAGRLTPELVLRSPQYMNCVQNYEIDLRGNKLGAIENLGATENQFDSIDFSDNAIVFLEGFPRLTRLKVLLLNNNRISRIGPDLVDCLPNLQMLILTNNKLDNLQALDPLGSLKHLDHLSLLGNPVTKVPHYRQYVVRLLPSLRILDFTKVKATERVEETEEHIFDPNKDVDMMESEEVKKKGPSFEQMTAIKAAIQNAETLEEVKQLEAALKSGNLPSQFQDTTPSDPSVKDSSTDQVMAEASDKG